MQKSGTFNVQDNVRNYLSQLNWVHIMRSTAFILIGILLTANLLVAKPTKGQKASDKKVTIAAKNITFSKLFEAIELQTGIAIMYENKNDLVNQKISVSVKQMPLGELLDKILRGKSLKWISRENVIRIDEAAESSNPAGHLNTPLISTFLDQSVPITGMIRSEEGDFLQGVSVRVKNSGIGTTTDNSGAFQLKHVEENSIIEISIIGYEKVEFTVIKSGEEFRLVTTSKVSFTVTNTSTTGGVFLSVNMKKAESILDEAQVIAYGKTSRRYSTGSVGTVKGEDIQRQPVMNVLQALEGRVPGLNIVPTTGNSAAPIQVEIRGRNSLNPGVSSEPLYVVDGVPQGVFNSGSLLGSIINTGYVQAGVTNTQGESPLFYLNPRDIESIDVLKDADATAIYGARGANGVILITTKRGKPGPTRFNLSINRGKTTIPRRMELLNTEEYLAVRKEALRNDGIEPDIYNAPDLMLWDQNKYTDWQDLFFAPGNRIGVDAGVSGGMAQTTYGLSASFQSQEELMNQGGKNIRGSFSGNLSHTSINQKFQFAFSSQLSVTSVDAIKPGNYVNTPPNAPDVYTEKGDFNFVPYRGLFQSNFPFNELKRPSESRTTVAANTLRLSYEIIKGLKISVSGGFNFANNDNAFFWPAASSDPLFPPSFSNAYFGKSSTNNWLVEPQIQYTTLVGKGNLSVQVGGSLQTAKNEGITTFGLLFPNDNLMRSPNNAAVKQVVEGSGEYKYSAAFAIINYRWENKYIINLNARRDGSSKFGPGKQFGNFGSAGLAWIASEEKWIESFLPSWWSFLKFRGSYGITGSDAVGDYEFLTRWGNSNSISGEEIYAYNGTVGFNLTRPVNPDFRWELTSKAEVAASMGFLNDRINIEASYYNNRSGNQLTMIGTPEYTGFSSVRANWDAVVENSGIEVSLNARLIQTKDWQVSANFNISKNKNKLVDYPGLENSSYADKYKIGQSLNLKYLFHYIGINPVTGDYVFEDYNKDGVVSYFTSAIPNSPADDRYIVFDLNPDYIGGMGLQVAYKGLSLFGSFTFKKQLKEDPYFDLQIGAMKNLFIPKEVAENRWQKPGDNALYPKYTTMPLNYNMRNSDRVYTDGSYLKLANLALSYNLPTGIINKLKIQSCTFSISTQNLFTITSFRGIDPEVGNMMRGAPIPRTVSSSLTFTF